jgi:hypothetical protein
MSGIRYRPRYTVLPKSPEIKKSIQSFSNRGNIRICCILSPPPPPPIKRIFNGGTPSSGGPNIKNGGSPSSGGSQIYNGGIPKI